MKAEHRKELQTNTLADHIGRWIQGLRQGMKATPTPSTLVVMIFVFLALVVFVGWRYYSSSEQRKRSHLWLELDEARSLALKSSLQVVIDRLGPLRARLEVGRRVDV